MTAEKAALVELGTDAERLAAKTAEMDRIARETRNAAIPAGYHVGKDGKIRKDRADRNKPRPKPAAAPAPAGALSQEQRTELMRLTQSRDDARMNLQAATDAFDDADAEWLDFVNGITAH